jgi:hypothetical protein
MSITVSQDLLRSNGTGAVQSGRVVRPTAGSTDSALTAAQNIAKNTEKSPVQGEGIRASGAVLAMLEAESAQRTVYDEPGQRQQRALSAYEDVLQQDKKAQLQQMFAIDLYA